MSSKETHDPKDRHDWNSLGPSVSLTSETGVFGQVAAHDSLGRMVAGKRFELVITGGKQGFRTQVLRPFEPDPVRIANSIADDVNLVASDRRASAVLGRIADTGVVTVEKMAAWFDSADDWIAFSRLQRARLLADHGTEFTLSPAGISFVDEALEHAG